MSRLVILSPSFLNKTWTQAELDALVSREANGLKVVLPVWHRVSHDELLMKSPLLAARLGISTSEGLEAVCKAVLRAIRPRELDGNGTHLQEQKEVDIWSQFSASARWDASERSSQFIGKRVGLYRVKNFVGAGGTEIVFEAVHVLAGTPVALKLFYPVSEEVTLLTRATERAVRGLASLRHRGIARLLDFGYLSPTKDGFSAYLACEFIEGRLLNDWSQSISMEADALQRRLRVAAEIAGAMESAHACRYIGDIGFQESGVLHGDLKPANIIVRFFDEQPKIVDFMEPDLQRILAGQHDNYTYWKKRENGTYWLDIPPTVVFGTVGYMPPEQAIDGTVLPVSDVYALGRTFFELFVPFEEEGQSPRTQKSRFYFCFKGC